MSTTMILSDTQLARLAELVAERLRPVYVPPSAPIAAHEPPAENPALVPARALADVLGVSRAFVYEHANKLGAIRLGDGPRARLRFNPETARAALSCYASEKSQPLLANGGGESVVPAPRRRRSLATRRPQAGSILSARPRKGAAA